MVAHWFLYGVAGASLLGALLSFRAAALRYRTVRKLDDSSADVLQLSGGAIAHDLHTAGLYLTIGLAVGVVAVTGRASGWYFMGVIALPVIVSLWLARYARRDARLTEARLRLEKRAQEMLQQTDTAPARWAERLAPAEMPATPGYEIGTVHEAVSGVMSGDLVDVFHLPSGRLCCVVGDVSGHDVEASITALQTKFLLRSYLRRYRDPGQALEELNRQVSDYERPEEFVSLCVMVFDGEAATMRYASAGHPPAWLSHDREVRALRATGPVLMMDPSATFLSKEIPFEKGDLVVSLSDGVAEARSGSQFFGEERIAAVVRRFDTAAPDELCREVVGAAQEFSSGPITDDITVLAVRRTE
ncbi:MAG: PP2C family protein-serine/threonine phosphatase [Acidimicrobiales bacterium]